MKIRLRNRLGYAAFLFLSYFILSATAVVMNLLYTLADYIEAKWHRLATRKELEKILNVICWNFWQMDGLNDTPPYGIPNDEVVQLPLFEDDETTDDEIIYCKIYDWRADISKLFKGLKKRGKGMKFDFVIGIIWIKNQYVFNVSIVSIALNRLFANHQENI